MILPDLIKMCFNELTGRELCICGSWIMTRGYYDIPTYSLIKQIYIILMPSGNIFNNFSENSWHFLGVSIGFQTLIRNTQNFSKYSFSRVFLDIFDFLGIFLISFQTFSYFLQIFQNFPKNLTTRKFEERNFEKYWHYGWSIIIIISRPK